MSETRKINESIPGWEAIFQAPPGFRILSLVPSELSPFPEGILVLGLIENTARGLLPTYSPHNPPPSPERLFDVGALICRQAIKAIRIQAMLCPDALSNQLGECQGQQSQ
jgi:hypothetical protein